MIFSVAIKKVLIFFVIFGTLWHHFTVTRGHFSKSLEECIHCVLCSVLTYLVGGLLYASVVVP